MSNASYSSCCNVSGSSGHLSENNLPTADRTPADINNINKYTDYSLMNLSPKMFWVFCMWAILTNFRNNRCWVFYWGLIVTVYGPAPGSNSHHSEFSFGDNLAGLKKHLFPSFSVTHTFSLHPTPQGSLAGCVSSPTSQWQPITLSDWLLSAESLIYWYVEDSDHQNFSSILIW